ncbi:hypothetical protein SBV1_390037 [Verrucomicrobia bacterium]|nr:hypothetical protein SBV1_390037 [Verrucomicrobiota bacterium]
MDPRGAVGVVTRSHPLPKSLWPKVRFKEKRAITYRSAQENRSLFTHCPAGRLVARGRAKGQAHRTEI